SERYHGCPGCSRNFFRRLVSGSVRSAAVRQLMKLKWDHDQSSSSRKYFLGGDFFLAFSRSFENDFLKKEFDHETALQVNKASPVCL
ncbi:hypothetical protein, partial [Lactobacillus nasalidis]|uniref:hypothetical protein n=1 Tax=Lactobacillus nasalidis TaxID=2797258 RepID=UPI001B7D7889